MPGTEHKQDLIPLLEWDGQASSSRMAGPGGAEEAQELWGQKRDRMGEDHMKPSVI